MKPAIQILMDEHRLIEQVLGSLETFVLSSAPEAPGGRVDVARFATFFQRFADRLHHGKEEDRLFEAMVRAGFPREAGPIGVMLYEHVEGRKCVGALAAAGTGEGDLPPADVAAVRSAAAAFIPLLRGHIQKEDQILYPMALQALDGGALDALVVSYRDFEANALAEGEEESLRALAHALAAQYPPDPARMAKASQLSGCLAHRG